MAENQRQLRPRNVPHILGNFLNPALPCCCFQTNGWQIRDGPTESWKNPEEAEVVVALVDQLMREYQLTAENIGVITPYVAQQIEI